jgi:ribokinase
MTRQHLAVLGSINMDVALGVGRFPLPGETVMATRVGRTPGGKGANQAVAAARMGHRVALMGAMGLDEDGQALLEFLHEAGVDQSRVARLRDASTGIAHVVVNDVGENTVIVFPGANHLVTSEQIRRDLPLAKVYLAQLEVPQASVSTFFSTARAHAGCCILNAAPATPWAPELFPMCDVVVMNETELAAYTGGGRTSDRHEIVERARQLLSRAGQTMVVTQGAEGSVAVGTAWATPIAAFPTRVIDTTGAGDCFCGVLATGMADGLRLEDAMQRASAAAALQVSRRGAGNAMPTLADTLSTLAA